MGRKIAVLTGTRAEYGLLFWTMHELQSRGAELQLIVTGSHLSPDHGMTIKHIEADGWPIAAKVDMQLKSDALADVARSMGTGLSGIATALDKLKPEIVVILGDRYEMLAAASAAAMLHIPIAHIHGGEVTIGAIDEAIRHAITKLSYWHFATAEPYRQRIIQLGEEPSRVFTCGAPGIDNLVRLKLLSREELEKTLGISLRPPVILFTYHPETLSHTTPELQVNTVIDALKTFPDATIIITGANADTGGRAINHALQDLVKNNPRAIFTMSLGSRNYLSAMSHCDVVAGNSSSAMIEAPSIGKASVNIGDRQEGRLRAESVIDCPCEAQAIADAIRRALSVKFQKSVIPSLLFGTPGQVAPFIAEELMSIAIPATPKKAFYNLR